MEPGEGRCGHRPGGTAGAVGFDASGRSFSVDAATKGNLPLWGKEHHVTPLAGQPKNQNFRHEPGDVPGSKIHRGDHQPSHQVLGSVERSELRAGRLLSQVAEIDPELIRRLACPFIWLGSSDPANPKIERLEGTDGVYRRLSQCSSSPRSTVTAVPPSFTRFPSSRTRTVPPRSEAW